MDQKTKNEVMTAIRRAMDPNNTLVDALAASWEGSQVTGPDLLFLSYEVFETIMDEVQRQTQPLAPS